MAANDTTLPQVCLFIQIYLVGLECPFVVEDLAFAFVVRACQIDQAVVRACQVVVQAYQVVVLVFQIVARAFQADQVVAQADQVVAQADWVVAQVCQVVARAFPFDQACSADQVVARAYQVDRVVALACQIVVQACQVVARAFSADQVDLVVARSPVARSGFGPFDRQDRISFEHLQEKYSIYLMHQSK